MKRVYGAGTELQALARARAYRVHVTPLPSSSSAGSSGGFGGGGGGVRTVSYWCFAPSLAMRELQSLGVRSIIITSGTLSPLPGYSLELGLSFPHTLENPHIILPEQIRVSVVGRGVSGKVLSSSYGRRDDEEYVSELGNTLAGLIRVVPGGGPRLLPQLFRHG